jgi:hypothetical protein
MIEVESEGKSQDHLRSGAVSVVGYFLYEELDLPLRFHRQQQEGRFGHPLRLLQLAPVGLHEDRSLVVVHLRESLIVPEQRC